MIVKLLTVLWLAVAFVLQDTPPARAAVTLVDEVSDIATGNVQDMTITGVTPPTSGELIVVTIISKSDSGGNLTVSNQSGFVSAVTSSSANILWKISDGTEGATYTLDHTITQEMVGNVYVFAGVSNSSPVFDVGTTAGDTATSLVTGPTASTGQAEGLAITLVKSGNNFSTSDDSFTWGGTATTSSTVNDGGQFSGSGTDVNATWAHAILDGQGTVQATSPTFNSEEDLTGLIAIFNAAGVAPPPAGGLLTNPIVIFLAIVPLYLGRLLRGNGHLRFGLIPFRLPPLR